MNSILNRLRESIVSNEVSPVPSPPEPCCICYEPIETRITLPCKHEFCMTCICTAYKDKQTCPMCRSPLNFPIVQGWLDEINDMNHPKHDRYITLIKDGLQRMTQMYTELKVDHKRLTKQVDEYKNRWECHVEQENAMAQEISRLRSQSTLVESNPIDRMNSGMQPHVASQSPSIDTPPHPKPKPSASRKGYRVIPFYMRQYDVM